MWNNYPEFKGFFDVSNSPQPVCTNRGVTRVRETSIERNCFHCASDQTRVAKTLGALVPTQKVQTARFRADQMRCL